MEDNFKFSGFPSNDEFEIPDKEEKKPSKNTDFDLNIDDLKKMIPPGLLNILDSLEGSGMVSTDEILKNAISSFDPNNKKMRIAIPLPPELSDDNEDDDDEISEEEYKLNSLSYLPIDDFGEIECYESENLYNEFIEKFGTDSTQYLDQFKGLQYSYLDDLTAQLPLDEIESLDFVETTNRFILFFAKPKDPTLYGFFVAIMKIENGDFLLFVPTFCNTFDIDENNDAKLFVIEDHPDLFSKSQNNKVFFNMLTLPALEFGINLYTAPKKNPLITPHQFGEIKNVRPVVKDDSQYLHIGFITSNESEEAILLKKDADYQIEQKTFPLYLKFESVKNNESLTHLSEILFKVNFNECKLFDNLELKFGSAYDQMLYVDVDFGQF